MNWALSCLTLGLKAGDQGIPRSCQVAAILAVACCAAPAAEQISEPTDYADHVSAAVAPNGDLYASWISYDGQGADVIKLRRKTSAGWQEPIVVTPLAADYFRTALAIQPDGRVWVSWAAQFDGNFDLYARSFKDGRWSTISRLTTHSQPDFHHRLETDSEGNLYLAWQSFRTGDSNIYLKIYDGQRWSASISVTGHEASDWEPAIAVDSQDRLYLAYDTYRHGDYDVFVRTLADGVLSEEYPVADSDSFEARATVAIDSQDRAWIGWDLQGENWGLDTPLWTLDSKVGDWGRPAPWTVRDPGGVSDKISLRYTTGIGLAVFHNGRRWTPKTHPLDALPDELTFSYEIPHLTVDSNGIPWLFFRHWIEKNDGGSMRHRPGAWRIHATAYAGETWSDPVLLAESQGSNDQRVATVNAADGKLWTIYPADDRVSAEGVTLDPSGRHGKAFAAALAPSSGAAPLLKALDPPKARPFKKTAWTDRRNEIALGEKRLNLYWGDLHRHTEISMDGGWDGTLFDMYRYAVDVAELDFISSTDHYYGGLGKDGVTTTYDWWRTQKTAALFYVPGAFLALFWYERSLRWPYGHRNVISPKRGTVAFEPTIPSAQQNDKFPRVDDEVKLWQTLKGQDVITIPHTIAAGGGGNWAYNDPGLEPLLEIYQGCRMSYETNTAPRVGPSNKYEDGLAASALDKGYKIGFIASSDHRSTHVSYAAVYAEEPTREGIFGGLQSRHAYAATDNIVMDVRVGDAIMGDATTTSKPPELRISARGTGPVHEEQIIKNGTHVYTHKGDGREVAFTYRDADAEQGESYYYVRLQQKDAQLAWASPIWVDYRP